MAFMSTKDNTFGGAVSERERGITDLLAMLTYRRPAGSRSERKFINRFLRPLGVDEDAAGNLIKRIGDAPVLWSSHTDTVHHRSGKQRIVMEGDVIRLAAGETSSCLGADCGAGVWLMREMILAQVPGLYVFHREEECGGTGSRFIAARCSSLVKDIKCAIAFDRFGRGSVITHQWGRCCSDAFAWSLCHAIGMGLRPDDTGVFTDTANYTDLIGECSNISVGYWDHHSPKETLDTTHLLALLDRLKRLDVTTLTFERQPGDDQWDDYRGYGSSSGYDARYADHYGVPDERIVSLVANNPSEVAAVLEAYGIAYHDLVDEVWERGGVIPTTSVS